MKKLVFCVIAPALLVGCGRSEHYSEAWQAQKAQCVAGNFDVCADIGHQARQQQGGPVTTPYPAFSHPIVD